MIDTSSYTQHSFRKVIVIEIIFALIIFSAIIITRCRIRRITRQDIWTPVTEIHRSTKSILSGNLEQEVQYDYSGEIGTLCHDFEQMRDEIRNGYLREKQSREKERVLYASISHDLNTPISIITFYLEQIRYGVASNEIDVQQTAEHALAKKLY